MLLAQCAYIVNNLTVAGKEKTNVTASNGTTFKVIYTLHNFPDESYEIVLCDKFGDKISIFHGDGNGNNKVLIEHICSHDSFDYYKAVHEYRDKTYEALFVNSNKKFIISETEKHMEKFYDSILMFNDNEGEIFELFAPAAKYLIINENNGDYIGAYAEYLILNGNNDILSKIQSFVNSPENIKCEIHTNEEILSICQELLSKYGV